MSMPMVDPWSGVSAEIVHADLYPCPPAWRIATALVDRHGLFYVWKGHGWMERDGERFALAPGDLALCRSGQRYAAGHDPARPLTVLSVGLRLSGPAGADPLRGLTLPDRLSLPAAAAQRFVAAATELIAEHQQRTSGAMLAAHGAALRLLALTLRLVEELPPELRHGLQKPLPGDASRLAAVLAHIDAHLGDRLTLAGLARIARLSPAYFSTFFRARAGVAPMEHLRQRRIEVARALLRDSDASIEAIARRVGFPDPFHFSRLFRKLVGVSPRDFRAQRADPWAP